MVKTQKVIEEVVHEEVLSVTCDVCDHEIEKDVTTEVGTLMMFRGHGDVVNNRFENYAECETTDLCKHCYKKVLEFLKANAISKDVKIPSFLSTSEDEEVEEIANLMFADESEDDDKHNLH